ncbi:MAG: ABC transporter permease [Gammaproteobacteria bacterium]|nr:ABC transporter permease [Gammaproteobacteria bacterium]
MINSIRLIFALSWRNLWRNKRRTLIILFAIILGVWAMIVTAAFMRGMVFQMLEDTVDNLAGHVQIHHPQYLDDPVIDNSFNPQSAAVSKLLQDPRIALSSTRIRLAAVIVSERESSGITMLGIDPAQESKVSFIGRSVVEGRFLDSTSDNGIVIGKALADKLQTRLGKRIVLMSQDINNEIADRGFRIVGIFDAPLDPTEKSFIFIAKDNAEKMLGLKNKASEIVLRLHNTDMVNSLVNDYAQFDKNIDVMSWLKAEPYLEMMIELMDSSMFIWYLIVFLAMAFGIINTLLMAVFERTREFGLFQALGQKPGFILFQVWLEAVLMIIVGLVIGNILSWLSVLATGDGIDVSVFARGMEMLNMSNIIPFVITFDDLIVANLTVAILGMLTGLYPAWRASRLVPAHAITRI